jgi:hypothetical protein
MSEGTTGSQAIRWILHPGSIDTLVGPGGGRPGIRISCVAGSTFSNKSLNIPNGAYGAMTALHPVIGGA